jgi:hypothetical protein
MEAPAWLDPAIGVLAGVIFVAALLMMFTGIFTAKDR